ncbi:putative sushi, von Willebrand factor type A, partial [Apostichopus japonicus]
MGRCTFRSLECERPLNQAGLTFGTDKPCYSENDVITYTCQGTFFGPSENICNGSSGWIYSQPVCKETVISCPSVSAPDNGIVDNNRDNYSVYDKVDIACNLGYTLVGAARKVCDSDGTFKPIYDPICTESLSVPQTSRPTTTFAITSTTSSSIATGVNVLSPSTKSNTGSSIEPYSTKPSTEPTERRTEPPASSLKPT